MPVKYRKILLKLSGESLAGPARKGIDRETIGRVADEISDIHDMGVEIGIVVGGGNIFRGIAGAADGMERTAADHMGMMATVVNALAIQHFLEERKVRTRVLSALGIEGVAERFVRREAVAHLKRGRVLIFAAGTGNPYFTTDTAAALRACEIGSEAVLKGTRVDGVYSADPEKDKSATLYKTVSYKEVLNRDLKVMDSTAFALCKENRIPIVVFRLVEGNLTRVIQGEDVGTTVKETG